MENSEKKWQELFQEINTKPEDLDSQIMDAVRAEAETVSETNEISPIIWNLLYGILGLAALAGIAYFFSILKETLSTSIYIVLPLLFVFALDYFLTNRRLSREIRT